MHAIAHAAAIPAVPFAGMSDDLEAVMSPAPVRSAPATFVSVCWKCGGSGAWNAPTSLGHHRCTACGGTGKKSYRTSPEARAKAKAQRAAAKDRKAEREAALADDRLAKFEAEHPALAAWWTGSDFPFAMAMREAVRKWGKLTERQQAAAEGAAAKLAAAKAARAARAEDAVAVDIGAIEQVFQTASGNGLQSPRLRLAGFVFSPAKSTSANAGAIYVKQDGVYLGKVLGGKLFRSRDCTDEQEADVVRVAAAPKDAAISYGRLTGSCAICGRALENKESIERGIGPICAEKFGW